MTNRIDKGFKIFQENRVKFIEIDEKNDYFEFEVIGDSGEIYNVYSDEGNCLCNCPDFMNRCNKKDGSFLCGHLSASIFLLQEFLMGFRRIPLTKGYYAIVSAEDYDWLNQYKWHVTFSDGKKGKHPYAQRGWRDKTQGNKTFFKKMHQDIMNPEEDELVHHLNKSGLENFRENLRNIPISEHMSHHRNRKKFGKTSRYPGVYSRKDRDGWLARIGVNGKNIHLYSGNSEEDAAKAYQWALNEIKHNRPVSPLEKLPETSNFKGVYYNKLSKNWIANISFNSKKIHLGSFNSENEAHRARLLAQSVIESEDQVEIDKLVNSSPIYSSKYPGVCWDKTRSKWMAYYKNKFLGRFDDEYEAHLAYEKVLNNLKMVG